MHTKYALPPAGETSPAVDVPGVDVSSPHIGVRAGHMPVQDCHRELRRAVVDVDVRALAVCCARDLNRWCPAVLAVIDRIAPVIDRVVGAALELARALQSQGSRILSPINSVQRS